MLKPRLLFSLLFIIVVLDNVASALTVSTIMQIISACHVEEMCHSVGIPDNTLFLTGYLILLSPTYLFFAPITGYLADKYSRKFALQICLWLSVAGYWLLLLANYQHNILFALLAVLLLNAGASSMTPVLAAIADISKGEQKSYLFGLITLVLMPIYLLVAEIGKISLHYSFIIDVRCLLIMIALVCTFINLILLKVSKGFERSKVLQSEQHSQPFSLLELASIFTRPIIILLIIFALFEFAGSWQFEHLSLTPPKNSIFADPNISTVLYFKVLIMVLSLLVLHPLLLKKYSSYQLLFLSLLCCSIAILGDSLIDYPVTDWIFIGLFTVGEIIFIPNVWRLLSDLTSIHHQGLIMGIKSIVWSLAWSIGVITGNKIDHISSLYFCVVGVNLLIFMSLFLAKYSLQKVRHDSGVK